MIPDGMISLKMAAIRFNVPYNTLYTAARYGALQCERVNGHMYVTADGMKKWMGGDRRCVIPKESQPVSVRMSRELKDELRAMSKAKGVTMNALVVDALEQMIAEEEKSNEKY